VNVMEYLLCGWGSEGSFAECLASRSDFKSLFSVIDWTSMPSHGTTLTLDSATTPCWLPRVDSHMTGWSLNRP